MAHVELTPQTVVITGDVTMDWHVARGEHAKDRAPVWNPSAWTRACWQRGGAALLADLIEAVAEELRQDGQGGYSIRQTGAPRDSVCPRDDQYHHSYALWSLFSDAKKQVWRVEEFLGLDQSQADAASTVGEWKRVVEPGDGAVPSLLTFVVPLLAVAILGEGALRVARVYLQRGERREEWDRMVAETFSKHTVICGVGELGRAVFQRLIAVDLNAEIVLVDTRPGVLAELAHSGPNVSHLQGDMTVLETLKAAQCQEARLIILASGNDAFNLEAGFKALQLNAEAEIWIRLYRSGLASVMDLRTKPNVHFLSPYERAAEALVEHVASTGRDPHSS